MVWRLDGYGAAHKLAWMHAVVSEKPEVTDKRTPSCAPPRQ